MFTRNHNNISRVVTFITTIFNRKFTFLALVPLQTIHTKQPFALLINRLPISFFQVNSEDGATPIGRCSLLFLLRHQNTLYTHTKAGENSQVLTQVVTANPTQNWT